MRVDSARRALAVLAARFYGAPAEALRIVGFTGTFGKTSTSEILRVLLDAGGARTGVLGSLGARYGAFHDPGNGLTTPAPVELHRALRGLRDAGADTAISGSDEPALAADGPRARPVVRRRADRRDHAGEHTDFHRTYEDYVAAKRLFLDYLAPDAVLAFDADNHVSAALAGEARVAVAAHARDPCARQGGGDAAVQLREIVLDHTGARFVCVTADAAGHRMHSPLLGPGHLRNVALAIAYATAAGVRPAAMPPPRCAPSCRSAGAWNVTKRLDARSSTIPPRTPRASARRSRSPICSQGPRPRAG